MTTRITSRDAIVTRNVNGSWTVAAIVGTHRRAETFYGYTKREAVAEFVRGVNDPEPRGHKAVCPIRVGGECLCGEWERQEYLERGA